MLTPQRNFGNVELPILTKLSECYKLWNSFFSRLPKTVRHTVGVKIDNIFIDCLELSLSAAYSARPDKIIITKKLSARFDQLKFFLKLIWEMKALDNDKYIAISTRLLPAGKMLGGWIKDLLKQP